jgi:SAM-dependent methyltransferase
MAAQGLIPRWIISLKLHRVLLTLLLILGAVWVVTQAWTTYRRHRKRRGIEGFNTADSGGPLQFLQNEHFLIRRNQDIYDDFTMQYYDRLHRTRDTATYIFDAVERLTQSSPEKSVILDVGCGSGEMIKYIQQSKGYKQVYGLDRSESAVRIAKSVGLPVIQGDTTAPMTFDKHTFSHIFLTGMTVYEFQDKTELFRNLYYWLMPNAYLIVHLVDRDRYDTIPVGAKPGLMTSSSTAGGLMSPVIVSTNRVTDAHVDFIDFVYESTVNVSEMDTNNLVTIKETFTDADTRKVRINEQTLYMNTIQDIVYQAQYAGFIVQGQFDLSKCGAVGDAHQYVFVFERPH